MLTHRHRPKRTHDALVSIKAGTKALVTSIKNFYTNPDIKDYYDALETLRMMTADYALLFWRTTQKVHSLSKEYSDEFTRQHRRMEKQAGSEKDKEKKSLKKKQKMVGEYESRLKEVRTSIQNYQDLANMFRLEAKHLERETTSQLILKEISLRSAAGILWRMRRAIVELDKLYNDTKFQKEYDRIAELGSALVVLFHRIRDKYKPALFQKYQNKHPELDLTFMKRRAEQMEDDIGRHLVSIGVRLSLDVDKVSKKGIRVVDKALKKAA